LLDDVILPVTGKGRTHVFNYYVIRVDQRTELRAALKEKGVDSGIYYPVPLHLQRCFRSLGYQEGDLPEAERAAKEVLALPLFPGLTTDQQEFVVASIAEFYKPAKKVLDTKRAPRGAI